MPIWDIIILSIFLRTLTSDKQQVLINLIAIFMRPQDASLCIAKL